MYEAKKAGRGRVTLFDRSLAQGMHERHVLEQALREAVDRGELSLVYQPIVSARTGRCDAFESLVRWHHPTRGLIGPVDFIPVAEQSGQIGQIGRWVLEEACRAAAAWPPSLGPGDGVNWEPPPVTVNVSVAQVLSGTLLDDVRRRRFPARSAGGAAANRNYRKHVRRRSSARHAGVRGTGAAAASAYCSMISAPVFLRWPTWGNCRSM